MDLRAAIAALSALAIWVGTSAHAQSPSRDDIARYASCGRLRSIPAYVEVDSARRLHVCARATTANIGPYMATAVVRHVGDTVFISPVVELPKGESVLMSEVSWVAYQVYLGPYRAGTRVRVRARGTGATQAQNVLLDTLVRIP